jgi:hypothetical protein
MCVVPFIILLQQWPWITVTMTLVAFDTTIASVIPLVALLTSPPMMWHKEQLWNFSVFQRVHLFQSCEVIV